MAGCGSDTVQKDLELDKSIVDEYIRENTHALRLFPASELAEKDKVLLPYWEYGFVLRSRQWGEQQLLKSPRYLILTGANAVTLNIDDLSEVTYGNDFDSLVL
jgi:hypothetical protein